MEGKIAKGSDEVQDERSEPKGILDESLNLARVRHGRRLERFGKISPLSQICVQINGGDTQLIREKEIKTKSNDFRIYTSNLY